MASKPLKRKSVAGGRITCPDSLAIYQDDVVPIPP